MGLATTTTRIFVQGDDEGPSSSKSPLIGHHDELDNKTGTTQSCTKKNWPSFPFAVYVIDDQVFRPGPHGTRYM
jgi:hypothetical protein